MGTKTSLLTFAALALLALPARADPTRGDPAAGKTVFEQNCVACHGAEGRGDGPAAVALNPKPANFHDPARQRTMTQATQIQVVTQGGASQQLSALMPAFGETLTPRQIQDVVTFIRQNFHDTALTQR